MYVTEADATWRAEIEAAPFREFSSLIDIVTNEVVVELLPDGVRAGVVDPANILAAKFNFGDLAFETVESEATTEEQPLYPLRMGTRTDYLTEPAGSLRFSRSDTAEIRFDVDARKATTVVDREGEPFTRIESFSAIDPDTIRGPEEIPQFDNDEWGRFSIDPEALRDALFWLTDGEGDYVELQFQDGGLVLENESGVDQREVSFDADPVDEPPEGTGLYSGDRLREIARGLKHTRMERCVLGFADDWPLKLLLEHQGWGAEADIMLAPRVSRDDLD